MPYRLISSFIQKTSNPQKPNIEIEVLQKNLKKSVYLIKSSKVKKFIIVNKKLKTLIREDVTEQFQETHETFLKITRRTALIYHPPEE